MLSVVMLNVVMLSVIMLNVIILSDVPLRYHTPGALTGSTPLLSSGSGSSMPNCAWAKVRWDFVRVTLALTFIVRLPICSHLTTKHTCSRTKLLASV
jgi:hypothetical protein